MLNFDLMDTVAGRQLYEMGLHKGEVNALKETVLDVLDTRFELVPHKMIDQIHAINQMDILKTLRTDALRCPDLESFKEQLEQEA